MSFNPTTGDYSRGASGFWIEKGEIAYPVSEMTVAGNLLKHVPRRPSPPTTWSSVTASTPPPCGLDGMTVAGL